MKGSVMMEPVFKLDKNKAAGNITCPQCGKPTCVKWDVFLDETYKIKRRVFFWMVDVSIHVVLDASLYYDPSCGYNRPEVRKWILESV